MTACPELWQYGFGVDTWIGMEDDPQVPTGCDYGCAPCPLTDFSAIGVAEAGNRYLRAGGSQPYDARGKTPRLEHFTPIPTPRMLTRERAPCWSNAGYEGFTNTICDCDYAALGWGTGDLDDGCSGIPNDNGLVLGNLPDIWGATGHNLRAFGEWLWCRLERGATDTGVHVMVDRTDRATAFMDLLFRSPSCQSNALVACVGHEQISPCDPGLGQSYINTHDAREVFHIMRLTYQNIQMGFPPNAVITPADIQARAIQNLALTHVVTFQGIFATDQIRHVNWGTNQGINPFISQYARAWAETPEVFAGITGKLAHCGSIVHGDIAITGVQTNACLVPHLMNPPDPRATFTNCYVAMRIILRVEMDIVNVTVDDPASCPVIVNPDGSVVGGEDYVQWLETGGKPFNPPRYAEWYGGTFYPDWPMFQLVQNAPCGFATAGRCCELANNLEDTVVSGWPTNWDNMTSTFTGSITFGFDAQLCNILCN